MVRALPPSTAESTAMVRNDSSVGRWQNPRSGLGGHQDKAIGATFLPSVALDRVTLDALYEFDAMTGRIVDREPDDAIRKGIELEGFEGLDKGAVERELSRLNVLEEIANARRWSRLYGGGALVLGLDDGQAFADPVNLPSLRKLRGVYAADRFDVTPAAFGTDPTLPSFGRPTAYFVGDSTGGHAPTVVHASRVIRFYGVELPPRLAMQREGWGASVIDRVWTALRNWNVSHEYTANIIGEFTQGVYKLKGLAEVMDSEDADLIIARLEVVRMAQSIIGHIALDADQEGFEKLATNVTGLKDLLAAFVDALVAVTEMPRTILLGEQPAGLGASADSEIRVWYDHVGAAQERIYSPPLRKVLELMLAGVNGPTGGEVPAGDLFSWVPLWAPTEAEAADTRLKHAQARQADLAAQVVSPDEARREDEVVELYHLTDADEAPEPLEGEGDPELAPTVEEEAERQESIEAPPQGETLLDAKTIGKRLGVSSRSVVGMHRRNEIRGWKIGGRWRFAYSDALTAAYQIVGGGA